MLYNRGFGAGPGGVGMWKAFCVSGSEALFAAALQFTHICFFTCMIDQYAAPAARGLYRYSTRLPLGAETSARCTRVLYSTRGMKGSKIDGFREAGGSVLRMKYIFVSARLVVSPQFAPPCETVYERFCIAMLSRHVCENDTPVTTTRI